MLRRTALALLFAATLDRKSTRLNSSHSLHDSLPIFPDGSHCLIDYAAPVWLVPAILGNHAPTNCVSSPFRCNSRSEEHTSELQSLPTRLSSDLSRWIALPYRLRSSSLVSSCYPRKSCSDELR